MHQNAHNTDTCFPNQNISVRKVVLEDQETLLYCILSIVNSVYYLDEKDTMATVYSYIRFSDISQIAGSSLARQKG